nr:MAG TPA: hypothetical protein [Caudoviricetes sp.]
MGDSEIRASRMDSLFSLSNKNIRVTSGIGRLLIKIEGT